MGWLILAAGRSKRFGGDKLLRCFPTTGKTLLEHCIEKYSGLGDPVLVITRPDHSELHTLLTQLHIPCAICPVSHLGMGSSLAWGVGQIAPNWPWVGVVLADMALIKRSTLRALKREISAANIVVPRFVGPDVGDKNPLSDTEIFPYSEVANSRGHPVLFGKAFFPLLQALCGDSGARGILQSQKQRIVEVVTCDYGVVADADTPDDLDSMATLLSVGKV